MDKKYVIGGLVLLAVVVGVAYRPAQWGIFSLRAREAVERVGRFPGAEQIGKLRDDLKAEATRHRLDPAALDVRLALEARDEGPVTMYFLLVDVSAHGRSFSYSGAIGRGHRIETAVDPALLQALEEQGVDVSRAQAPEPAAAPEGE